MQTAVLDSIKDTCSLVPDRRAAHFWDAVGILPRLFGGVLRLPAGYPAWDVYLIYPRGVTWEKEPPAPVYWQHQLPGVTAAPQLHGETFAERLRLIMGAAP